MRRPQVSTAIEGQSEYKEDQAKDEFEEEEAEEEEQVITGQDIFIDYEKIIIILLSFLNSNDAESTSKDLDNEPHEIYCQVQFIAIKWLQDILDIAPTGF